MGVGKSKFKGILPFEEAIERLNAEERAVIEVAFRQATEKDDLTGKLKRSQFSQIPLLLESDIILPSEGKIHGDCIFHAFDRGNKGYLVYEDFAIGYVIAVLGTPTEKLKFTVRLYDWDECGYVSKGDFLKIFYQLMKEDGAVEDPDRRKKWGLGRRKEGDLKMAISRHVDEIFEKVRKATPSSPSEIGLLTFYFIFHSTPRGLNPKKNAFNLSIWNDFSRAAMREQSRSSLSSKKTTLMFPSQLNSTFLDFFVACTQFHLIVPFHFISYIKRSNPQQK